MCKSYYKQKNKEHIKEIEDENSVRKRENAYVSFTPVEIAPKDISYKINLIRV